MPVYDYGCACGGRFVLSRPIAARDAAAACPACGGPGARALSAPRLALLPRATRIAHARNERSAHEPSRFQRQPATETAARRAPLSSGHHGRPWMLGH